jgi:hypothetical protein
VTLYWILPCQLPLSFPQLPHFKLTMGPKKSAPLNKRSTRSQDPNANKKAKAGPVPLPGRGRKNAATTAAAAAAAAKKAASDAALAAAAAKQAVGVDLSDTSDSDDQSADGAALPLYGAWRNIPADGAVLVSVPGETCKRMSVKDALAVFKKVRKQKKNICSVCDAHPHCGLVGHNADDCNAVAEDGSVLCPACVTSTADALCERCGILVCPSCVGGDGDTNTQICSLCAMASTKKSKPKKTSVGAGLLQDGLGPVGVAGPPHGAVDAFAPVSSLMVPSQSTAAVRGNFLSANTGNSTHMAKGLRGMTDPKLRSDRPIMVCDMLIGNTLAGQEFDSLDESLVVADGKITVSKKSKLIQVKDEIEWCACNVRLQAYMVEHGLLTQAEIMPYNHYSLKIMDLMRLKQFAAVMEFDWMCRLAVWRGLSTWSSSFTQEYEAAFTDKANGACKHVSALWCIFCSSETHNPGGVESCIFRFPDNGGGKPGGGAPHNPKGPTAAERAAQSAKDKAAHTPTPVPAGDSMSRSGTFWWAIDGQQTCFLWNTKGKCKHGANCKHLHTCHKCKEPGHPAKGCKKPLAT